MNKLNQVIILIFLIFVFTPLVAQDETIYIVDTIRQKESTDKYCFDIILSHEGKNIIEDVEYIHINVLDKETMGIFQVIDFDESDCTGYNVYVGKDMLSVMDYNFDGYVDFSIPLWSDSRLGQIGYGYYLFDTRLNKFVESYFLSGLCIGGDNDGSGFDPPNKTVTEVCYATKFEALKSVYKFVECDSTVLLSSDSVYFAPIDSLDNLFGAYSEDYTWAELYGMDYEDPWHAIFHTFPVKEKENADIYLKLALKYSEDSLTFSGNTFDYKSVSEAIMQQIVAAFPKNENGWLAYGDIMYNKYRFTKDEDALSIMGDAYEKYAELMRAKRKKRKIPGYVYERIKERDSYLKNQSNDDSQF
ncbi:XAC2610-related protein [Coprobacter tertius]|uniref:Uncharacterized protein n=1 Tax=Coprobacter tertius TaxID=2944915 RepID=A0ABT1MF04_9BACT|nr:hypothetical protein [Coprobacter tertius]MCP9611209.1 hypothetical protein [Coprobacter tertius]